MDWEENQAFTLFFSHKRKDEDEDERPVENGDRDGKEWKERASTRELIDQIKLVCTCEYITMSSTIMHNYSAPKRKNLKN